MLQMALAAAGAAAELLDKLLQQSRQVVRPLLGNPQLPYYRQEGTPEAETPYLEAILLFTTACFILELYLDWRQYARLKLDKPPEMVS